MKLFRVFLKRKSSDDLDDYIGKWHDGESDYGVYKSFPGIFKVLFFSLSREEHISDVEKYRDADYTDQPHHVSLDIFEEVILESDIGTLARTIHPIAD